MDPEFWEGGCSLLKRKVTITLWVAGALFALGVILCGVTLWSVGFVPERLSTVQSQLQRQEYAYALGDGQGVALSLDWADVEIALSPDQQVHLSCLVGDDWRYEVTQHDGMLYVEQYRHAKRSGHLRWYDALTQVSFGSDGQQTGPDVQLLLPEDFSGTVSVQTGSGDVDARAVSADVLAIATGSGDVGVSELSVNGAVTLSTGSGDISLLNVTAGGDAALSTGSGDTALSGLVCDHVAAESGSGDISFDALDAQELSLNTGSGDISGSLPYPTQSYTVYSSTLSGDSNLPERWSGGARTLRVETGSGDIWVSFSD